MDSSDDGSPSPVRRAKKTHQIVSSSSESDDEATHTNQSAATIDENVASEDDGTPNVSGSDRDSDRDSGGSDASSGIIDVSLADAAVDEQIEAQCYSPRARQSMGFGRQDLETDSETDVSGRADSDVEDIVANGSVMRDHSLHSNASGLLEESLNGTSVEVPDSDDGDVDVEEVMSPIAADRSLVDLSNDDSVVADEHDVMSPIASDRSLALDLSNDSVVAEPHHSSTADSRDQSEAGLLEEDLKSSTKLERSFEFDQSTASSSNDVQLIPAVVEEPFVLSSDDGEEVPPLPATPVRIKPPLVQQKITAFTPKAVKPKYVSAQYMSEQQAKRWDMQAQLANNKKLLATLQHTLPDKGAALQARIPLLEAELQRQDAYLQTLQVEESKPMGGARPAVVDDWGAISAAINAIKPVHTGSQGLNTFNTQKALTVDRLQQLHASLETCPSEDTLAATPKGLRVELMDHQRYALSWMAWRERQKPRGGILADDMGLGKTLTVIALVLAQNQREDDEESPSSDSEAENEDDEDEDRRKSLHHGGTLVVCPASLINQWEGEVNNRLRRNLLNVVVHHGTKRDVRAKYLARNDIVITTYAIVAREHKDRGVLFAIQWARIILDEAHVIRNHKALQSEACVKLRGSRRWSLTGTPIQNKEMDIYAQLRFLRCTPFNDLAVYKKWIGNQSAGNQERMNNIMRPMLLRRTKAQLQEKGSLQALPSKTLQTVHVKLNKDEMNVYQRILSYSKTLFSQFLHQRAERQHDFMHSDRGDRPTSERSHNPNEAYDRMHQRVQKLHGKPEVKSHQILTFILRLRQICCHAGLIDSMLEDDDGNVSEHSISMPEVDLLEQLNHLNLNDESTGSHANESLLENSRDQAMARASSKLLQRSNPVFNAHRASSKFEHALRLVVGAILPANEKAVVVSQWTSVLELFREHLEAAGVKYVRLTGAVAVKDRNDLVVQFNQKSSGVQVMLLSLTAGGVGLNLIGGNHLLLLDPHWNPQLEAQAQDRVYRVGQTKPVQIYKFVCDGTIEERICTLQEKKMAMASDMLNGVRHTSASKLTIDDMKALFDM